MSPGLTILILIGAGIPAWYFYQVATRKKERIRYKLRRLTVAIIVYLVIAKLLISQGLPPLEATAGAPSDTAVSFYSRSSGDRYQSSNRYDDPKEENGTNKGKKKM